MKEPSDTRERRLRCPAFVILQLGFVKEVFDFKKAAR